MSDPCWEIAECAKILSAEFRDDFIHFMMDLSKDISNKAGARDNDTLSHILMLINCGLCVMWMATELSHYEPTTADKLMEMFIDEIRKTTPELHKQYVQLMERNGEGNGQGAH